MPVLADSPLRAEGGRCACRMNWRMDPGLSILQLGGAWQPAAAHAPLNLLSSYGEVLHPSAIGEMIHSQVYHVLCLPAFRLVDEQQEMALDRDDIDDGPQVDRFQAGFEDIA